MYLLEGRQWVCLYHFRLLIVLSNYNRVRIAMHVSFGGFKGAHRSVYGRCSRLLRSQCDVCCVCGGSGKALFPSPKRSICCVSGRNARGPQTHITSSVHLPVCLFISLCIILSTPLQSLHFAPAYILHNTAKYIRYEYAVIQHTNIQLHATQQMLFFFHRARKSNERPPQFLLSKGSWRLSAAGDTEDIVQWRGGAGRKGTPSRAKGDAEKRGGGRRKGW